MTTINIRITLCDDSSVEEWTKRINKCLARDNPLCEDQTIRIQIPEMMGLFPIDAKYDDKGKVVDAVFDLNWQYYFKSDSNSHIIFR